MTPEEFHSSLYKATDEALDNAKTPIKGDHWKLVSHMFGVMATLAIAATRALISVAQSTHTLTQQTALLSKLQAWQKNQTCTCDAPANWMSKNDGIRCYYHAAEELLR